MTYVTTVGRNGQITLAPYSELFPPGSHVEIIRTCVGSLIITRVDPLPTVDVEFRALEGGAAQLAARNALRDAGVVR